MVIDPVIMMKRVSATTLSHPAHIILQQKDERELYSNNPVDYYALHYRRRIKAVCRYLSHSKAKRILEIGAAQGNISLCCAESGARCAAVDINFDYLTYSKLKHEKGEHCRVQANADALPFKPGSFDAIILGELLEHCAWPERILAKAGMLIDKDGKLIITTPNNHYLHGTEQTFGNVAAGREAIEKYQFGPDGDNHLFTFTSNELAGVVADAGLRVIRRRYLGSHFLHLPVLYHLRTGFPFFFNVVLEQIVPLIPLLRQRYTSTLLFIVGKGRAPDARC
jgi:2-polyprenyl-3-methyl-5-hydroxy-6-metoxy-1,4-benzoquinol methylase